MQPSQDHKPISSPHTTRRVSLSELCIYLGGLLVIVSGVILVSTSWEKWGSLLRIGVATLPMMLSLLGGVWLMRKFAYRNIAMALLVTGSLLTPLSLGVVALETFFFLDPVNSGLFLGIGLLSLFVYLALNKAYPHSVWILFISFAGLVSYYFLLDVLGIVSGPQERLTAWMMVIPAVFLFLFSVLFHSSNSITESRYFYLISSCLLGSIYLRLTGAALLDVVPRFWIGAFLVLGISHLLLGVALERSRYKDLTQGPFLIGLLLVTMSLLSAASLGIKDWLPLQSLYSLPERQSGALAHFFSSIIFLSIGAVLHKMRRHHSMEISPDFILVKQFQLNQIVATIGSFWILAALYMLGTKGSWPVLALIALLASVGCVFVSIFTSSRWYLAIGTVFMVINIFSLGGEYFQYNLSWPVVLVICGLLTMFMGVMVEWLRKKNHHSTT